MQELRLRDKCPSNTLSFTCSIANVLLALYCLPTKLPL